MRHRALRRNGGQVAAEVSLRAAVASAALEGHALRPEEVRAGTVTDPVVQGALRVAEGLGGLVDLWPRAPRQVLARLHVLAARGVFPADDLGRLDLRGADRLDALAALVAGNDADPTAAARRDRARRAAHAAPVRRPGRGGGPRRRPAHPDRPRASTPAAWSRVEVGHLEREPEYVGSAGAYATGTPDGVRSWLRHYAAAVEVGADEITAIGDGVLRRRLTGPC